MRQLDVAREPSYDLRSTMMAPNVGLIRPVRPGFAGVLPGRSKFVTRTREELPKTSRFGFSGRSTGVLQPLDSLEESSACCP